MGRWSNFDITVPNPWWWLPIGGVLAVAFVIYTYRRETAVGPAKRAFLALLRLALFAIALLILLKPTWTFEDQREVPSEAVLLVDSTPSMDIRDRRKQEAELLDAAIAAGRADWPNERLLVTAWKVQKALAASLKAFEREERKDAIDQARTAESLLEDLHLPAPSEDAGEERFVTELAGMSSATEDLVQSLNQADEDANATLACYDRANEQAQSLLAQLHPLMDGLTTEEQKALVNMSRSEVCRGLVFSDDVDLVGRLNRNHRVHAFGFDQQLRVMEPTDAVDADDQPSNRASSTRLGDMLLACADRFDKASLAGIVVATDGVSNSGRDMADVARQLGRRGIPVYPIGIGLSNVDDVIIDSPVVPKVVFGEELVSVRCRVRAKGFENRDSVLSLALDGDVVDQEAILLSGRGRYHDLTFRAPEKEGTVTVTLSVGNVEGEAAINNNKMESTIRVVNKKLQVLYISGSPRWEHRYLRAILLRDSRLSVDLWTTEGDAQLVRDSQRHVGRYPDDPETAFSYDLVIIGDVDPANFSATQMELLQRHIQATGASLIVIAGRKHMPSQYFGTPLTRMLPVNVLAEEPIVADEEAYPVLTPAGQQAIQMRLVDDEVANVAKWTTVRPMRYLPALDGAKPGATVLAELSDSFGLGAYPLISWHRYGTGKVLFVSTDRLWRLRSKVGDEFHTRFWIQTIQFLTLSRLMGEGSRFQIATDSQEVNVGSRMMIHAVVHDELFQPDSSPRHFVDVRALGSTAAAAQRVELRAVPGKPGFFIGSHVPARAGRIEIVPSDVSPGDDAESAEGSEPGVLVDVAEPASELNDTQMNEAELRRVAALSGGEYFSIGDLPILPEVLRPKSRIENHTRRISLWDSWVMFAVFLAVAGCQWWLRRRWSLA